MYVVGKNLEKKRKEWPCKTMYTVKWQNKKSKSKKMLGLKWERKEMKEERGKRNES